jgi:predicted nucleic acid-binding protein
VSDARKLFSLICQEKAQAFATANSITYIYFITAKRLGEATAREAVKQLLKMLGIISVDGEDCAAALNFLMSDFEDALVAVCANKEEIDYIVTNDKEFLQSATDETDVISLRDFHALKCWTQT